MQDPNLLEMRVKHLEGLVDSMSKGQHLDMTNDLMNDAQGMAIYSIVMELAERTGIATEDFARHFEIRLQWWHDHFLKRAEGISPDRVAALDSRTIEQAAVEATYPSIFELPPPEPTPCK